VYTFGEASIHIYHALKSADPESDCRHFNDKTELANALRSIAGCGSAVLFKASRGIGLEQVIELWK
jgi:UDP-N-acetylmuramyl pentapeptide synthase